MSKLKSSTVFTWQPIPQALVNKKISIQATYIYGKLLMLTNKWYSETTLGINPISRESELTQHQVSNYVNELSTSGLLEIEKVPVTGQGYNRNIYHPVHFIGYWGAVTNDFINLTTLTAKEKGFAMQLASFPDYMIPKSVNGISKLLHIAKDTTRKYLNRLKEVGIMSDNFELDATYFPSLQANHSKTLYESRLAELRLITGSQRIQKQLDWLESTDLDYNSKLKQLDKIEAGLL